MGDVCAVCSIVSPRKTIALRVKCTMQCNRTKRASHNQLERAEIMIHDQVLRRAMI